MKMNILVSICGRGGSKGIIGKNIKQLAGVPLIAYTINIAKLFSKNFSNHNVHIGLSTDSEEIKKVAKEFGLETTYNRPPFLATDTVGKIDVLKDLLFFTEKEKDIRFDLLLDLDITSPLRTLNDLIEAYEIIINDKNCLNLFSVNKANRNPYFNMVEKKDNGYYHLVKKANEVLSRQKAPEVYDLNASFYYYKREFFNLNLNTPFTDFTLIYKLNHICFDLDEELDFEFLSFLINQNKLNFII